MQCLDLHLALLASGRICVRQASAECLGWYQPTQNMIGTNGGHRKFAGQACFVMQEEFYFFNLPRAGINGHLCLLLLN